DNLGNVKTDASNPVTIQGAPFVGPISQTPVNGVATFSGLVVSTRAASLVSTAPLPANLSAGVGTLNLTINGTAFVVNFAGGETPAQVLTAINNASFASALKANVASQTASGLLLLTSPPASAPSTAVTGGSKLASLNLVAAVANGYTIAATTPGATTVVSTTDLTLNITDGPAQQLTVTAQPATRQVSGNPIRFSVAITDAQGNVITTAPVTQITAGIGA